MTDHEPESANRWATEHYGFEEEAVNPDPHATDAAVAPTPSRPTSVGHDAPRSRRGTTYLVSAVLGVALVAGIGGTAVASDHGPGDGRAGITHVDGGGHHGGRGRR